MLLLKIRGDHGVPSGQSRDGTGGRSGRGTGGDTVTDLREGESVGVDMPPSVQVGSDGLRNGHEPARRLVTSARLFCGVTGGRYRHWPDQLVERGCHGLPER